MSLDSERSGVRDVQLERLLDVEQIRVLKTLEMRYNDARDYRALRRLYTDDARVDFYTFAFTGADEFIEAIEGARTASGERFIHQATNPDIEITGPTTARGIWLVSYVMDANGDNPQLGFGQSHEEYSKDNDVWKISRVRWVGSGRYQLQHLTPRQI